MITLVTTSRVFIGSKAGILKGEYIINDADKYVVLMFEQRCKTRGDSDSFLHEKATR